MPRGDKSSYTTKQKRQAEHIEEDYEHRGMSHKEAKRRAWVTVNKGLTAEKRAVQAAAGRRIIYPRARAGVWVEERRRVVGGRTFSLVQEGRPDVQAARGLSTDQAQEESRVKPA